MRTSKEKIETILHSNYSFQLGEYLSNGWEIFKKGFWSFTGFTLVFTAIQVGLSLIPIIGSLGSIIVSAPLAAGYYLFANRVARNEYQEFNIFFKGFDHIGPLLLQSVIQFLAIFGLAIPLIYTAFSGFFSSGNLFETDPEAWLEDPGALFAPAPWAWIFLLPIVYLSIAWRWAPLFIIFYSMQPFEALETSRKLITRQWFLFFIFYIIVGLIVAGGLLFLFVGILFTLSFIFCADYAAFSKITQLIDKTTQDDVSNHFIEHH